MGADAGMEVGMLWRRMMLVHLVDRGTATAADSLAGVEEGSGATGSVATGWTGASAAAAAAADVGSIDRAIHPVKGFSPEKPFFPPPSLCLSLFFPSRASPVRSLVTLTRVRSLTTACTQGQTHARWGEEKKQQQQRRQEPMLRA